MKIKYLIFLICIGCAQQESFQITNLNGNRIDVIGHGGSGFQSFDNPYPANSFTSIKRAIDGMNADGIEVDVQMSEDSVLVLFHDQRLESLTDGDGFVFERSFDYLQNCRYNNDFALNITMNEKIISLKKIVGYIQNYHPKPEIYLDIKLYNSSIEYSNRMAKQLAQLINIYNAHEWINIQSYSLNFLKTIKNIDPGIGLFLKAPERESTVNNILANDLSGIVVLFNAVSQNDIDGLHHNGIFVVLYVKKSKRDLISAIEKNPDAIQTDNIPLLQSLLY